MSTVLLMFEIFLRVDEKEKPYIGAITASKYIPIEHATLLMQLDAFNIKSLSVCKVKSRSYMAIGPVFDPVSNDGKYIIRCDATVSRPNRVFSAEAIIHDIVATYFISAGWTTDYTVVPEPHTCKE